MRSSPSRVSASVSVYRVFQITIARNDLDQWYSTWGTRTPGGTRRHLRGYVKLKKNIYYFMINTLLITDKIFNRIIFFEKISLFLYKFYMIGNNIFVI
jgi:hypothetical protein